MFFINIFSGLVEKGLSPCVQFSRNSGLIFSHVDKITRH